MPNLSFRLWLESGETVGRMLAAVAGNPFDPATRHILADALEEFDYNSPASVHAAEWLRRDGPLFNHQRRRRTTTWTPSSEGVGHELIFHNPRNISGGELDFDGLVEIFKSDEDWYWNGTESPLLGKQTPSNMGTLPHTHYSSYKFETAAWITQGVEYYDYEEPGHGQESGDYPGPSSDWLRVEAVNPSDAIPPILMVLAAVAGGVRNAKL